MSDKYRDNRSDRSRRDEPVNEIKKQILDAAPDTTQATASNQAATTTDSAKQADSADRTPSETQFRPDQVPGHLGYNTSDNLLNVNPKIEEF